MDWSSGSYPPLRMDPSTTRGEVGRGGEVQRAAKIMTLQLIHVPCEGRWGATRITFSFLFRSFCRISQLLDTVCRETDEAAYFTALWQCVLGSPSVRLPALSLLLARLNKRLTAEDQPHCLGGSIPLLVRMYNQVSLHGHT